MSLFHKQGGQLVNSTGIQPNPEKVEAILDIPIPANVGDIRRFLGVTNQMSKLVPNLAGTSI